MSYWTHEYLLKNWGGPMVQAEFIRDASKPFFTPKIFSGYNLFLDKPQLLPDSVDLIAKECKNKKAFIVTDDYAVRFAPKIRSPYEKRHGSRLSHAMFYHPDLQSGYSRNLQHPSARLSG